VRRYYNGPSNIKFCAFGIGEDFDEELMKSIADIGAGSYFFIEGSSSIPKFVTIALKDILNSIGTDALLKVRGLNGCAINKIYGGDQNTFLIGDLTSDNLREVLVDVSIIGKPDIEEEEFLYYQLIFSPFKMRPSASVEPEKVKINGSLSIKYTNDPSNVEQSHNYQVSDACIMQQMSITHKRVIKHLDDGKNSEAVSLLDELEKRIRRTKEDKHDNNSNLENFIQETKKLRQKIMEQGSNPQLVLKKKIHHMQHAIEKGDHGYITGYFAVIHNDNRVNESGSSGSQSPPRKHKKGGSKRDKKQVEEEEKDETGYVNDKDMEQMEKKGGLKKKSEKPSFVDDGQNSEGNIGYTNDKQTKKEIGGYNGGKYVSNDGGGYLSNNSQYSKSSGKKVNKKTKSSHEGETGHVDRHSGKKSKHTKGKNKDRDEDIEDKGRNYVNVIEGGNQDTGYMNVISNKPSKGKGSNEEGRKYLNDVEDENPQKNTGYINTTGSAKPNDKNKKRDDKNPKRDEYEETGYVVRINSKHTKGKK